MDDLLASCIIGVLALALLISLAAHLVRCARNNRVRPRHLDPEDNVGLLGSPSSRKLNGSMTITVVDDQGRTLSRHTSGETRSTLSAQPSAVSDFGLSYTQLAGSSSSLSSDH
jgi:hypothetical protein